MGIIGKVNNFRNILMTGNSKKGYFEKNYYVSNKFT